jgi:predicted PurR-regulated permease PerM
MGDQQGPRLPEITSPSWQTGTRLLFAVCLLVLAAAVLLSLTELLPPFVLALMLAYLLHPLVSKVERTLRVGRVAAVLLVYVSILLALAGATTWIGLSVTQQIIGLVQDLTQLSAQLPGQLQALSQASLHFGPWMVDLSKVNLDPLVNSLVSTFQPLLSQTGSLMATAVGATASTVGMLVLVLVMGYYLARDFGHLADSLLGLIPGPYREDFHKLLDETGRVWQAFLRGQVILALAMGVSSAVVFATLGLRFSLGLGLIAGLMEFVPLFGPIIAGLLAVLVALFQPSNWWGLTPLVYALVVLGGAVVLQQLENNILVPRIIGHSLNLHPLIVLMAALSGGILAGVLGILLAAPTVATLRMWLGYIYRKTVGLDTWPQPVIDRRASPKPSRRLASLRDWLARKRRAETEATTEAQTDDARSNTGAADG